MAQVSRNHEALLNRCESTKVTKISWNTTRSSSACFSLQSEGQWRSRTREAQPRPGKCYMALQYKSNLSLFTGFHLCSFQIMCPLKHLLQENITCSLMCLLRQNIFSQDTFRKTSHGTTAFPKKPDIFTLGFNFHLLWPLGFQGIFTGKCLWQDSLWLTKADTLDWPVAVRNNCKVQVSVPSSSNSFLLVGVVGQRQSWVGPGFLRLPACSTGRRQISVTIILLLGDFFLDSSQSSLTHQNC